MYKYCEKTYVGFKLRFDLLVEVSRKKISREVVMCHEEFEEIQSFGARS